MIRLKLEIKSIKDVNYVWIEDENGNGRMYRGYRNNRQDAGTIAPDKAEMAQCKRFKCLMPEVTRILNTPKERAEWQERYDEAEGWVKGKHYSKLQTFIFARLWGKEE